MLSVEETFNAFVKASGGELVSDLFPKAPDFRNADYVFRNHPSGKVVAELKCLEEDLFLEKKLNELFDKWTAQGRMKPFWGEIKFKSQDLPSDMQKEVFEKLGGPIKKHVDKANVQIKTTKDRLGLKDAKGLLLLVNDGNYSLQFNCVPFLLMKALGRDHSGINSVIYFTVNMRAQMVGIERETLIWSPMHRVGVPTVPSEFLQWLWTSWREFHEKTLGEPVPVFAGEKLDDVKFVDPPKPRLFYRFHNRAFIELRKEISRQMDIVITACQGFDRGERGLMTQMAPAVLRLLERTPNSRSLVHEYLGNVEIRLRSTTMLDVQEKNPYFLGLIGPELSTAQFRPAGDDTSRSDLIPLKSWWETEAVMKLVGNETITRKEIVLSAAAENDGKLTDERYQLLQRGLTVDARTKSGKTLRLNFQHAELAALRQIAHELLTSKDLTSLAF